MVEVETKWEAINAELTSSRSREMTSSYIARLGYWHTIDRNRINSVTKSADNGVSILNKPLLL